MGNVTITRGVNYRDDFIIITAWQLFNTANVSVPTITTDGDIGTLSMTFTSAVSGNNGAIFTSGLSLLVATYPFIAIRTSFGTITNVQGQLQVTYTDNSVDSIVITPTAGQTYVVIDLRTFSGTGKTIKQVAFAFVAKGSATGSVSMFIDFIQSFKETLTLPIISQPVEPRLTRRAVEQQIPFREGGLSQDLGSPSMAIVVKGQLVTTSTPNNYSAIGWSQVLTGVWLENNSNVDAQGAPTWQWFTSDLISYKFTVTGFHAKPLAARGGFLFDFELNLKKFDVLSATAQTFGAIQ